MTDPDAIDRDYLPRDLEPLPERDWRWKEDLRPQRHGWGPGDYIATCKRCGDRYIGAKRSNECADCAYSRPVLGEVPRLIGLCGNPHAGKSEVQRLLEGFGYTPADDAWPVRDFTIRHFGLTLEDVTTQAGKDRTVEVCGQSMKVREVLGKAANSLEGQFGEDIMAWLAVQGLDPGRLYSFGSVRRRQGKVYKSLGGVIIGVRRPDAPPSPFEFDSFDESVIDHWIDNDGDLNDLAAKVKALVWRLVEMKAAA